MLKTKLAKLLLFLFIIGFGGHAYAALINLDARTNNYDNPVSKFFRAGTYSVFPIGKTDGGDYNAWSAWSHGEKGHWLNPYYMESKEFKKVEIGQWTRYDSDLLALDKAENTTFTLSSDGYVKFFIKDNPISDNRGGISLKINSVPIPGALWLFGSGLVGLIGLRRVRKNSLNSV